MRGEDAQSVDSESSGESSLSRGGVSAAAKTTRIVTELFLPMSEDAASFTVFHEEGGAEGAARRELYRRLEEYLRTVRGATASAEGFARLAREIFLEFS